MQGAGNPGLGLAAFGVIAALVASCGGDTGGSGGQDGPTVSGAGGQPLGSDGASGESATGGDDSSIGDAGRVNVARAGAPTTTVTDGAGGTGTEGTGGTPGDGGTENAGGTITVAAGGSGTGGSGGFVVGVGGAEAAGASGAVTGGAVGTETGGAVGTETGGAVGTETGGAVGTETGGAVGTETGGAGGSVDAPAAVAEFLDEFATPFCTRLQECCEAGGFAVPSLEACQENELRFTNGHLEDGTAHVVPELAEAFRESIATTCDQPPYESMSVTRGTFEAGASCEDVGQCAGETVMCDVTGGSDLGICRPLVRGELGDPCLSTCTGDGCRFTLYRGDGDDNPAIACWDDDGLYCSTESHQCVAVNPSGQSCESYQECGETAECTSGVCVDHVGVGQDCSNGGYCESTLICDTGTYTCVKMSIAYRAGCEL